MLSGRFRMDTLERRDLLKEVKTVGRVLRGWK